MSSRQSYALTLRLIDSLRGKDSWCGETHVQKTMYVFSTLFHVQSDLNFTLYKHGPYSFKLHDLINDLYGLKFIEAEQRPPYGPRIRLTEAGHSFMAQIPEPEGLDHVTERLGKKTVQDLEKLATALMISLNYPQPGVAERASYLHSIKPHISLEEAEQATRGMDAMCLELTAVS